MARTSRQSRARRLTRFLAVLACGAWLAGCSRSPPPPAVATATGPQASPAVLSVSDKLAYDKELVSLESCDASEAQQNPQYDVATKRIADELKRDAGSLAPAKVRESEGVRMPQNLKDRIDLDLGALRAMGADPGSPLELRLKARTYRAFYMSQLLDKCRPSYTLLEFIQKK